MKKNSSSFIIINDARNIDDQDHDDDYLNIMKKDKAKKIVKFEKYKPKVSSSKIKETNLDGAESKVKSLLSLFLHNIETEEKKDKDSNSLFLNEIESVKKIQRQNKFETTKKINIYYNRNNSNILHKKEDFNKLGTMSSFSQDYIRAHSLQFSINNKKNTLKNKRTAKKNQEKSYFFKNKRKGSLIKDNIDINEAVNFKSSLGISSNHNNINFIKKTNTNSPETGVKNNLEKYKSININHTPIKKKIKNSSIHKYSTVKGEKDFSESKLKKKMRNSLKISNKKKNSICKDESNRGSILSNDSKSILKILTENKNEIKFEDQIKDSSFTIKNKEGYNICSSYVNKNKTNSIIRTSNISVNKKDDSGSKSKRSSLNSSSNSNKNNLLGRVMKKRRLFSSNKSFHRIMREITDSSGINKDLFKVETNTLFKVETTLKNLQEKIKQTIILRPEDLALDFSEGVKPFIKKGNTIVCKEKKEPKNNHLSSKSIISHLSKKNELDISKNNTSDIKKTENISTLIKNIEKNQDQAYQMASEDLLKSENDDELQENVSQSKFIKLHEKYRVFIHRNQVYDSFDDEEVEDEVSNYIYFSPDSKFIMVFDAVLLFLTIYSLFWIPFYLAHNLNFCKEKIFKFKNVLNLFIEFMNLLDLFFGFFKAYYNFEEQLINKNSNIAKKYLTGWFIIDIVSAIPFYTIFKFQEKKCSSLELSTKYYDNTLYNLNYLYMCNRMLKMIKVFFTNQAYQYLSNNYQEKKPILKLIIYLIRISCILFVFHYCACLYIFIGRNSYPNWILYTKLEIKPFVDIYVCAIYMLITTLTTVGYGDITCYSLQERLFQLFLLIIGIMSYSFAVTSFSNYIQKINEKSAEYEKRKDILDDIKLNNPNLPDKLYDRILRYLKYKNLSEKRDKNIILDSLPVGLKNNLVCEMYKPVIKNFIFFKNFENTDFIVRVILSFRPIIAIKNDILVNEGDIIEEIMFMKKGVLSIELPINIKNPQENVEKYLNMTILRIEKGPDLEKVGNNSIINNTNMSINNTTILGNTVITGKNVEKKINKAKADNKKKFDETTYVKILNIRENEHFGDVLMFLEKRSPLRARVRSKKAELFFLKKTDAVKISSSYQNIWKRINKKSVFNFEQIKKSIYKIIEIYSAFDTIRAISEHNENIKKRKKYRKTMLISNKRKLKLALEINQKIRCKSEKNILNWKNKYFNDSITETKLSRNKSAKKFSSKIINLNSSSFSYYSDSDNDESELEENVYQKDSSKVKNKKSNSRLLYAYNGHYKFYKGANNKYNLNVIDSIIDEEPANEDTVTPLKKNDLGIFNRVPSKYKKKKTSLFKHNFKKTDSIHQGLEKSASLKPGIKENSKYNLNFYSNNIKCINEKNEFEEKKKDNFNSNCNNSENSKKLKIKEIKTCDKSKYNKKEFDSSSGSDKISIINESEIRSLSSGKKESSNKISNINDINKNELTPFKKEDINEEIYSDEIFNISKKEENLFSREIKMSNILNRLQNNPDNFSQDNNKIQFLLDSIKENSSNSQNNINQIQIINNNIENINTNLNIYKETNEIKINTKNCCNCKNCKNNSCAINSTLTNTKATLSYSIIKNIEIEYKSLYENLNQITNYKYSLNTDLQNKVKNLITESSPIISSDTSNRNILVKKQTTSSLNKNPILSSNNQKFVTTINSLTKFKNACSLYRINSITNQNSNGFNNKIYKKHKSRKRNTPLTKRSETFSDLPEPKMMRSTSIGNYKSKTNKFQTGIGCSLNNKNIAFVGKFGINAQKTLRSKNGFEKQKINNNENIISKKMKGEKIEFPILSGFLGGDIKQKNSMRVNPNFFSKKKKGNLLSQINLNIEKTNQNLNNPEEFYTNYFNSILGGSGEQLKVDTKKSKRRCSAICLSNKTIIFPKGKKKK